MPGIKPTPVKGEAPLVASTEVVVATLKKIGIAGSRECANRASPSGEGYSAANGRRVPEFCGARFRLQKRVSGLAPILTGGR